MWICNHLFGEVQYRLDTGPQKREHKNSVWVSSGSDVY